MPLQIHARYTRREIMDAFGRKCARRRRHGNLVSSRRRVRILISSPSLSISPVAPFSPTTRYRDYAVSPNFHPLGEPIRDTSRRTDGEPGTAIMPREGRSITFSASV